MVSLDRGRRRRCASKRSRSRLLRSRTVARVTPARRSLRSPLRSPAQPHHCLRRHENHRLPPIPAGLLTARVHRNAASLTALSRTKQPQKRYSTVNQSILEVADDSRLRGDNARNAIGPDVRFSRTCASPLEGSPASKAASTPARSPSPSPTAVSNVVCRRQLRLRRTDLVLRRHQVRTRGEACLF